MPPVNLSFEHGKSYDTARRNFEKGITHAHAKFGMFIHTVVWSDDRTSARLTGTGFEVNLRLDESMVHATGRVPIFPAFSKARSASSSPRPSRTEEREPSGAFRKTTARSLTILPLKCSAKAIRPGMARKVNEYCASGCRLVWLIDHFVVLDVEDDWAFQSIDKMTNTGRQTGRCGSIDGIRVRYRLDRDAASSSPDRCLAFRSLACVPGEKSIAVGFKRTETRTI